MPMIPQSLIFWRDALVGMYSCFQVRHRFCHGDRNFEEALTAIKSFHVYIQKAICGASNNRPFSKRI